ncbi:MAG TPA: DedA family protein/thiosulfate sulfurtransferase GlpE [Burkholderiales bacterium]|nr:DedA family protein/thiosulfate sulfurtransferase GlpE [Burkholderiales bacterium]
MQEITRLIAQHGLWLVFGNVLIEQVGLPVPAIPTLVIAGALAVDGRLSAWAVFGAAFVACTLGDVLWYLAGRIYGRRVMRLLCRISLSPDSCVRQTENHFERWGGTALVLAKFIPGLSGIAPPLAGATRLPWAYFLLLNSLGVVIWAGVAIGAGMLFHAEIDRLLSRMDGLGSWALGTIVALLAGYIALKWWQRRRLHKMLRVARITAGELKKLFEDEKRPVVVDVRSSVGRDQDPRFIPGALRMDMAEVEDKLEQLPVERDIIFYCDCPNEASAAHVAKRLMDLGYTRVRPLHGGLDAWIAAGYAVEQRSPG